MALILSLIKLSSQVELDIGWVVQDHASKLIEHNRSSPLGFV